MTSGADLLRAATMAARTLVEQRVTALPILPQRLLHACPDTRVYTIDLAADVLGIPAVHLETLFRSADAVTFRRNDRGRELYIVVFRADGNPARLRFTLAHELGHRLLHHGDATLADEAEADCFASHLLCPAPIIDGLRTRAAHPADLADRVAQCCYVTRSCALAALKRKPIRLPADLAQDLALLCAGTLLETRPPKAE